MPYRPRSKKTTARRRSSGGMTSQVSSPKTLGKRKPNQKPIPRNGSRKRALSDGTDDTLNSLNLPLKKLNGFKLNQDIGNDTAKNSELNEKKKAILTTYRKMNEIVPDLDRLSKRAAAVSTHTLNELANTLDSAAKKGRIDDCSSLRENRLKYIPRHEKYPEVVFGTKKGDRGFYHLTTACLLCPRSLREQFDQAPDAFCKEVLSGIQVISHDDWPLFLYPEDGYEPEIVNHSLLQGPFLLACFRHIFTGPRTALKQTPGTLPGKKSIAKIHDITEVTPENIAYVAVMCCCDFGSGPVPSRSQVDLGWSRTELELAARESTKS
ncbi:hypothetical protein BC826DRAFT_971634 [Russula brevipes]|nr:hypothetical protein BC826DRAFT_971634 [Russula brevipes]